MRLKNKISKNIYSQFYQEGGAIPVYEGRPRGGGFEFPVYKARPYTQTGGFALGKAFSAATKPLFKQIVPLARKTILPLAKKYVLPAAKNIVKDIGKKVFHKSLQEAGDVIGGKTSFKKAFKNVTKHARDAGREHLKRKFKGGSVGIPRIKVRKIKSRKKKNNQLDLFTEI